MVAKLPLVKHKILHSKSNFFRMSLTFFALIYDDFFGVWIKISSRCMKVFKGQEETDIKFSFKGC